MAARDWLTTLWPASYKGIPFFVEKDDLDGGRRIASHEFPFRDDPQHEDLGSSVAKWEVTAYLASDRADAEASALLAVFDTPGPGPLVLPIDGPVLARAHKWRRARELDRAGWIGISVTFLREGAAGVGSTLSGLAQAVFDRVDDLGSAIDSLVAAADTADRADWVTEAFAASLVDLAAGVESVAASVLDDQTTSRLVTASLTAVVAAIDAGVAPATSAGLGLTMAALDLAPPPSDATAGSIVASVARAVADAAISSDPTNGPGRVIEAFADRIAAPAVVSAAPSATASRTAMERNAVLIDVVDRLTALGVTAEAIVRANWVSRRDGVAARGAFVDGCDRILESLSSLGIAFAAESVRIACALRATTVDWLTRSIADLSPIRTVRLASELPSTVVAWMLWADPTRAGELVARNHVPHPGFMPQVFEALVE